MLPKDNQKSEKEGIGEIKRTTGKAIKHIGIKSSKNFFKQVNFCPFTHAVSEGANVYFQFEIIIPLKN